MLLSRFSLVGLAATAVYFVAANLLMRFGSLAPEVASVIAYLVGMFVSFVGQSRFTFEIPRSTAGQAMRFAVLSVIGLGVSFYSVRLAAGYFGVAPFWGTVATSIFIPAFSFFVMKLWVFKP